MKNESVRRSLRRDTRFSKITFSRLIKADTPSHPAVAVGQRLQPRDSAFIHFLSPQNLQEAFQSLVDTCPSCDCSLDEAGVLSFLQTDRQLVSCYW